MKIEHQVFGYKDLKGEFLLQSEINGSMVLIPKDLPQFLKSADFVHQKPLKNGIDVYALSQKGNMARLNNKLIGNTFSLHFVL